MLWMVMDKSQVNNQTLYPILINELDTGGDIQGQLKITDWNYTLTKTINGQTITGPKVIVYLRGRDATTGEPYLAIYNNVSSADFEPTSFVSQQALDRTAGYIPLANQTYVWYRGQRCIDQRYELYKSSEWLGMDWAAKDPDDIIESWTKTIDAIPLSEGIIIGSTLPSEGYYQFTYEKLVTSAEELISEDHWSKRSGFLGLGRTYYDEYYYEESYKNFFTHWVKADFSIGITFIGWDANDDEVQVKITSVGDIILSGSIDNPAGSTTIISTNGQIINNGDQNLIETRDLTLRAATGIGSLNGRPIYVQLSANGWVNATTVDGDISIDARIGSLTVKQATTVGDISLTAEQNIIPYNTASLVSGGLVTLTAENGYIGTSAVLPLYLYVGQTFRDGLTATAAGNIFVQQINAGTTDTDNLQIFKVYSSGGDIWIKVVNGSLLDYLSEESPDTRTIAELEALWNALNLYGAAADAAIQTTINSYNDMITQLYHSYWNMRNMQSDSSVYDSGFAFHYSADERANYKASLGWTDTQVDALEVKRTAEYHTLHSIYGVLGNTYNSSWSYASDTDVYEPDAVAVDTGTDQISFGTTGHVFRTGQGVIYHSVPQRFQDWLMERCILSLL